MHHGHWGPKNPVPAEILEKKIEAETSYLAFSALVLRQLQVNNGPYDPWTNTYIYIYVYIIDVYIYK